ncbi:hypothetical protein COCON_G00040590 [Conger conger]|uniref:Protein FAM53C n=1 Tax=Conger conger TaxID=82655 RepID=A0A9Q1DTI5_CONCO|nr:hypothetical protein COCON_G00040590 [Conger conger]
MGVLSPVQSRPSSEQDSVQLFLGCVAPLCHWLIPVQGSTARFRAVSLTLPVPVLNAALRRQRSALRLSGALLLTRDPESALGRLKRQRHPLYSAEPGDLSNHLKMVPLPESHTPRIYWPACGLTPESGCWLYTPAKPPLQEALPLPAPPPPPPPKRHCRPEDLPRCRSSWRPSASRVWTARRLSLSPVHVREATAHFLPPAPPLAGGGPPPSPSSACSTPASFRRPLPLPLPRCHSQPCGLKRRHAPDLPCPRPGLDFSKMTQTRSGDPLGCWGQVSGACGRGLCMGLELVSGDLRSIFSPAEGLGRTSICPLSESEEEEEEEEEEEDGGRRKSELEGPPQCLFERDCTELDLTLIEEN